MFNDGGTTVVRKRMSCLGILALGLTAILVTTIISATGIALYGLRLFDKKSETLVELVEQAARGLPELREALPPVLADALDDERRPDYADELRVSVRFAKGASRSRYPRAVVEVENLGDEVVSLLSMRIVGLDENGDPVAERDAWAATPLQIDDEWRGPLLPHRTRRFVVRCFHGQEAVDLTHEITEVRIWQPGGDEAPDRIAIATADADGDDEDDD